MDPQLKECLNLYISYLISVGCLFIGIASVIVQPPHHLPHLWSLLISVYCASHFIFFLIYFHILQFRYYFGTGIHVTENEGKTTKQHIVYNRWTENDYEVLLESKKKQWNPYSYWYYLRMIESVIIVIPVISGWYNANQNYSVVIPTLNYLISSKHRKKNFWKYWRI